MSTTSPFGVYLAFVALLASGVMLAPTALGAEADTGFNEFCGGSSGYEQRLEVTADEPPRFDFDLEGDVGFGSSARNETFRFAASAIVKIEQLTPSADPDQPAHTLLACALVDAGTVYALHRPFLHGPADDGRLLLTLVGAAKETEAFRKARTDALFLQLKDAEVSALLRVVDLNHVREAGEAVLANTATGSRVQALAMAVDTALNKLEERKKATCEATMLGSLMKLNHATCEVHAEVVSVLKRLGSRPWPKSPNLVESPNLADIKDAIAKLAVWAEKAKEARPADHCESVAALAGHDESLALAPWRVLARAVLPELAPQHVRAVPYGYGFHRFEGVRPGPTAILLVGTPLAEKVEFEARKRDPIARSGPAEVIGRFLQTAVPLLASREFAGSRALASAKREPELEQPGTFACPQVTPGVDLAAPPLSEREAVTSPLVMLDDTAVQEVLICTGGKCPGDQSDPRVKNRVQLVPAEGNHLALVAEFSGNLALSAHPGFRGPLSPAFEPVGGLSGPDQMYELRYSGDVRQGFSAALLLAYVVDRFMIGGGPSLVLGAPGALPQLNLRVGYRIAPAVFLTFGPGVRPAKEALDYKEGDRIVAPRPAPPDQVKAPEFRQRDVFEFTLAAGVALDLAGMVNGGTDLVKSLGGPAK